MMVPDSRWLLAAVLAIRSLPAQAALDPRDPATYLPLLVGTQWTWRSTWTGDDGKPYEHVRRARVHGLAPAGAEGTCTQILFDEGGGEYFAVRREGLMRFGDATIGGRGATAECWPILSAPVGAVTRWDWRTERTYQSTAMQGGVRRPRVPEYDHHLRELLGFDVEVAVPAGTFHCVHVRESLRGEDGTYAPVREQWYGRGVGLVREVFLPRGGERLLTEFVPADPARADRDAVLRAWIQARPGAAQATVEWVPPEDWSLYLRGDFAVVRRGEGSAELVFVDDGVATPFALDDAAFWNVRLGPRQRGGVARPLGVQNAAAAIASLRAAQLGLLAVRTRTRSFRQNLAADADTYELWDTFAGADGERAVGVKVRCAGEAMTISIEIRP